MVSSAVWGKAPAARQNSYKILEQFIQKAYKISDIFSAAKGGKMVELTESLSNLVELTSPENQMDLS